MTHRRYLAALLVVLAVGAYAPAPCSARQDAANAVAAKATAQDMVCVLIYGAGGLCGFVQSHLAGDTFTVTSACTEPMGKL